MFKNNKGRYFIDQNESSDDQDFLIWYMDREANYFSTEKQYSVK